MVVVLRFVFTDDTEAGNEVGDTVFMLAESLSILDKL